MKTHYRGFDITLDAAGEWSAEIAHAGTGKRWSRRPSVPLGAGSDACLHKARSLVDAFIALHGHEAA